MKCYKMIVFSLFIVHCTLLSAQVETLIFDKSTLQEQRDIPRFRQHEVNQLRWDFSEGGRLYQHLDAQLSVSYLLTEPNAENFNKEDTKADWNIALAGTIEFDFFVGTRMSSPVVGRRYNPSLQFYYSLNQERALQQWRFSIEHESNGQSTDNIETLNELTRSFEQQYIDSSEVTAQDAFNLATETISLSNNFVSVGGVYRFSSDENASVCDQKIFCVDLHIKLRHQVFGDEQNGEFRSFENRLDRLRDYQGTRLSLASRWSDKSSIDVSVRSGQLAGGRPFNNNTLDINYFYVWHVSNLDIPISISYRTGYLEELYNYSTRSSSWRVGLNFLY